MLNGDDLVSHAHETPPAIFNSVGLLGGPTDVERAKLVGNLIWFYTEKKRQGTTGWTQQDLARDADVSVSLLTKAERGRGVRDVRKLRRIEMALDVRKGRLLDVVIGQTTTIRISYRPSMDQLRGVVFARSSSAVSTSGIETDFSARVLEHALDKFKELTSDALTFADLSSYEKLVDVLVRLIPDLETATSSARDSVRPELLKYLVNVYQVASSVLTKAGDCGAALLIADRAIHVAEQGDESYLILEARVCMARALFDSGDTVEARFVLQPIRDQVNAASILADPRLLSAMVSGVLALGELEASGSQKQEAERALRIAIHLARMSVECRTVTDTTPDQINVRLHAVTIYVRLGDGQRALKEAGEKAARIAEFGSRLSPAQHARFFVDVARAHLLTKEPVKAVDDLLMVATRAPEELPNRVMALALLGKIENQYAASRTPPNQQLVELQRHICG